MEKLPAESDSFLKKYAIILCSSNSEELYDVVHIALQAIAAPGSWGWAQRRWALGSLLSDGQSFKVNVMEFYILNIKIEILHVY